MTDWLSVCKPRSFASAYMTYAALLCNTRIGQLASKAARKSLGLAEKGFTASKR